MKIQKNEETGLLELVFMAVLQAISSEVRTTEPNSDYPGGTEYRFCQVEVTYPGDTEPTTVDSSIWENSLNAPALVGCFVPGADVSLTTILEGDSKGYSKVGLPIMRRVDVTKFDLDKIELAEEGKSVLKEHVIEEEEVI